MTETQTTQTTGSRDTPYDRWIGRYITEVMADGEGWHHYYPVIDRSGLITGIADADDEGHVVVDWTRPQPQIHLCDDATDAMFPVARLTDAERAQYHRLIGCDPE